MRKKSDNPSDQKPIRAEQADKLEERSDSKTPARRKALAAGALGAVVWKTPILNAVVLPAHAQTSITTTTMAPVPKQIVTPGPSNFTVPVIFVPTP